MIRAELRLVVGSRAILLIGATFAEEVAAAANQGVDESDDENEAEVWNRKEAGVYVSGQPIARGAKTG